jgi:hypothetical protein
MSTKDLSGAAWVARFPSSKSVSDLDNDFKSKVEEFQKALTDAGASYDIKATKRPEERAFLMHWSWKIAKAGQDPKQVPSMEGVEIEWWHGDLAKSKAAAEAMVDGYEIKKLGVAPALNSRHREGKAIDLAVTWSGNLKIKQKDGIEKTISTTPRTSENADLIAVGKTYGLIHFNPPAKDKNHWSTDGH